MSFWKKSNETPLNSSEYEKISKRLTEFAGTIEEIKNNFKILETNYNNLRGNFNRKLSGLKEEEKVAPKEEEMSGETNIKPSVFLSPNGTPL